MNFAKPFFVKGTPKRLRYINQDCTGNFCKRWADIEWDKPGIYAWVFDERYVYIGKSLCLRKRIYEHVQFLTGKTEFSGTGRYHRRVARKYAFSARFVVLESGSVDREDLSELEHHWLWQIVQYSDLKSVNMSMHPTNSCLSAKNAAKSIKKWFAKTRNKKKFVDRVKKQWEDPKFRELQAERLKRLRAKGWKPTPSLFFDLETPEGEKFIVTNEFLRKTLRCGTNGGAVEKIFQKSILLAEWKITNPRKLGGYSRLSTQRDETLLSKNASFKEITLLRRQLGEKTFLVKPCAFSYSGKSFKALRTKDLKAHMKELRSKRDWHIKGENGPMKIEYFSSYQEFKMHPGKCVRILNGANMKNSYDGG